MTDNQIKAWYIKASASKVPYDYQLAASSYQNANDTYPEGEANKDFWQCVESSRQALVDFGFKVEN